MPRDSMDELILKVRSFIGDPAGANIRFTDDEIEDALDNRRRDVYLLHLTPVESRTSGGVIEYRDYFSPDGGWWEKDVKVQNTDYTTLTTLTTPAISDSDYLVGKWTFSASVTGPVYLTGKQYDLNGAAADLLDAWLAAVKLDFDFLELNATYKSSQQAEMLEKAIAKYRRRQWVTTSPMIRTDELRGWY